MLALLFPLLALPAIAQPVTINWINSPQATFAIPSERATWFMLTTDAERAHFRELYWARRDPTPGTERNEFREAIERRIEVADRRFGIDTIPGSETARGLVFILLGTPAKATDNHLTATPPGASNVDDFQGNEIITTWHYDRLRTPKILDVLDRPAFDVTFLVEPSRRRDLLQPPGAMDTIKQIVARRSIVTMVPGGFDEIPGPHFSEIENKRLDDLSGGASPLHSSVVWADDATSTRLWVVVPGHSTAQTLTLTARIRDAQGNTTAAVLRQAEPWRGFSTIEPALVIGTRLQLPPGTYSCDLMVTHAAPQAVVAAASGKVTVPERGEAFAVSSLLLTGAPQSQDGGIRIGTRTVAPRADATFRADESLWYLFEVANAQDPTAVTLSVLVRNKDDGSARQINLPASLEPVGAGQYLGGYEMPLSTLGPGHYSLYAMLGSTAAAQQIRRADFRVVTH